MTQAIQPQNVWIQNFSKLDSGIKVYELSFPNQFDMRKFTSLKYKDNKTTEDQERLTVERDKVLKIIDAYRDNQQLAPDVIPESMCTLANATIPLGSMCSHRCL